MKKENYMLEAWRTRVCYIFCFLISIGMAGCSGDDEIGGEVHEEEPGKDLPFWALGTGNANMPSGGIITAEYPDMQKETGLSKLVDNNVNSKYVTKQNQFEVIWNGNRMVSVQSYLLTSATDAPEMDPKSWTLFGSSDNVTWAVIDRQKEQQFIRRKETKLYEVNNKTSYRNYKLSVTENNGGDCTQMAEWVLSTFNFVDDMGDLMRYADDYTYSSLTPMGRQHENDREASAKDLQWLSDASAEPDRFDVFTYDAFKVNTLYPSGIPIPSDVNQRAIGDCCVCAAMASMAYLFPQYIMHIIKDNGDRTFAVSCFDPKGKVIEVGVSDSFVVNYDGKSLGAVASKGGTPTWATVIEKALLKWCQVYKGSPNVGGMGTEYFVPILTGNGTTFAFGSGRMSATQLQSAVSASFSMRKIMVGGFNASGLTVDPKTGFATVSGHAYSFFPANDNSYLFGMRNPWGFVPINGGGNSDGKEDGVLRIADDGTIPPSVDVRICDPGAAKGYATFGDLVRYVPRF